MKKGNISIVVIVAMIFITTMLTGAFGDELSWNADEGSWHDSGKWLSGSTGLTGNVPVNDDTVDISNGGTAELHVGPNVSIGKLLIGKNTGTTGTLNIVAGGALTTADEVSVASGDKSTGTVTVSGAGSRLNAGAKMYVGNQGKGTLVVKESAVVTTADQLHIGYKKDSDGTVTVSGTGSQLNAGAKMYVGNKDKSKGTLEVKDGAVVTAADRLSIGCNKGSTGTVTVSGKGSQLNARTKDNDAMAVGDGGTGTLEVKEGAVVTAAGQLIIAYNAGSKGTVTVSGEGSTLTAGNTTIGANSTGTLEVKEGGKVEVQELNAGYWDVGNGTVTVSGKGSTLTAGNTHIGWDGTGILNVTDGGKMTANKELYVGVYAGSNGTVTVSGEGSTLTVAGSNTVIGWDGTGTLNVTDGGKVEAENFGVGYRNGSNGTVTVQGVGSELNARGIKIGVDENSTGTLEVKEGGKVEVKELVAGFHGGGNGTVTVSGEGSTLTAGYTYIGLEGNGTLEVKDGGKVTAETFVVGGLAGSDGNVTVQGENSSIDTVNTIIGLEGNGTLEVKDGGKVKAGTFGVGVLAGSDGNVTVQGKDSSLDAGEIYIGFKGTGTLNVLDGGTVTTDILEVWTGGTVDVTGGGDFSVSSYADNKGTITGSGTALKMTGDNATVENSGTVTGTTGVLFAGTGTGRLINSGTITGTGGTAVDMGKGDNEVILYTGSAINGNVDGGDGTDSITLVGTGTISSGSALNFENISKTGTGTWTIGGNLSSGKELYLEGGVLRVEGQYTQEKGSKLRVAFTDGKAGLISADTAQLDGGMVIMAGYAKVGRHTIIETDNGLTGTFEGLDPGEENIGRYLGYVPGYEGKEAFIDVYRSRLFADDAMTPNQRAVAGYLDHIYNDISGDMITVFNELMRVPDAAAGRFAFDQMGGASHTAFAAADTYRVAAFYRNLFGGSPPAAVMRDAMAGRGPARLAANMNVLTDAGSTHVARDVKKDPFNLWIKGYGLTGSRSGTDIASRYDYTIGGAMAGADLSFIPSARAGFALGYARTEMDMSDLRDKGSEDSVQGALYGSWKPGDTRWYTDLAFAYSRNSYKTTRYIDFGNIHRQARASYNGYDLSGYLEGGYRLPAHTAGLSVTPYASFLALRSRRDGFTETGADSLNLVAGAASTTSLQGSLGVRLAQEFMMDRDRGFSLVPEISGRWVHEFGDDTSSIDARFAGAPSGTFTVSSDTQDRDSGIFSLGVTGRMKDSLSFFLVYDGQVRSKETAHALTGGVKFSW